MAAREGGLRSPGPVTQLQIIKVQCELCKVKINATSYKRHMKTQHDLGQGKKWQCQLCFKILESKARLNGHEKTHNNQAKEKEFQCDKCSYASSNKNYLRDHKRRIHTAQEGLWMCFKDKCQTKPKSFLNNDLLSKHQNTHNDLPCPKCPKRFGAKRNMKKHMAIKHREDKEVNENRASVTVNIAHLDLPSVDVGDLLTIPVTVDSLPIDPFA